MPRRLLVALVTAALLITLPACSDSSDELDDFDATSAPRDASLDDFCATVEDFALLEPSLGEDVDDWPEKLVEVGTPDSMTQQERHGFEVWVTAYHDHSGELDSDDGLDLIEWDDALSPAENEARVTFYDGFVHDHCDPYGEHE